MGRYSCAIGGCEEKTYKKSKGVKFYHMKGFSGTHAVAVKEFFLNTRLDLTNVSEIKDSVICSQHFEDGDKNNLPTIIPRKISGKVEWPSPKKKGET